MTRTDGLTGILDWLQIALDDPEASPSDLAAQAHLSRFHFDRLVAAATGEPPGALRRRLLLERAAHRLTTSDRTVLDLAVEAGYGSHEAFTRAFQRSYGIGPTAVRRRPPLTFRALELPCPSGVHFQPPGGLRLPAARQETPMNVLQHLVDHHVQTLTAIIDRAGTLDDKVLDRPVRVSVETIDDEPTLRSLINAMVPRRSTGCRRCAGASGRTRATARWPGWPPGTPSPAGTGRLSWRRRWPPAPWPTPSSTPRARRRPATRWAGPSVT